MLSFFYLFTLNIWQGLKEEVNEQSERESKLQVLFATSSQIRDSLQYQINLAPQHPPEENAE